MGGDPKCPGLGGGGTLTEQQGGLTNAMIPNDNTEDRKLETSYASFSVKTLKKHNGERARTIPMKATEDD